MIRLTAELVKLAAALTTVAALTVILLAAAYTAAVTITQ